MAMIHISRSGGTLGVFDEARVREGLGTGEFIDTDLGWTEGMATWRPLSELESFRAEPAPQVPPPPVAPSRALPVEPASFTPEVSPVVQAEGLPWENRARLGFLNALFATIGMVLTRPSEAFTVMKRDAGIGDPLLYALLIGTAGGIVSFGFSLIINSLGLMAGRGGLSDIMGAGVSSFFMLIMTPIIVVVGTFIAAGLLHVCLMLVGGAKRSFETTYRVVAYGGGSANVFQLVPVCGSMITVVTSLVLYCIGLARAHETDTGRAVAAVLLPVVVCCGGALLLGVMFSGLAAFAR